MAAQNAHVATTYTVGWIAALAIERAAATAMLDDRHSQPKDFKKNGSDSNQYTWGRIGSHHVVIASLPSGTYGTNAAAVTARSMLASLPWIRTGLLVGIGAGVPNLEKGYDIRLGDVVVSQPQGTTGGVIQYDLAKAKDGTIRPTGMLNMPPEAIRSAIAALQAEHEMMPSTIPDLLSEMALKYPQMAKSTPQKPGYVHQEQAADVYISNGLEVERPARDSIVPEIFYGTIASGNLLVKDAEERDAVLARLDGPEDILCFEMEAAGLMNSFPCIVIRGICDYADSNKNDVWQRYASATAACFAKELLSFMDADEVQQAVAIGEIKDLVNVVQEDLTRLRVAGEATQTLLSEMRTDKQQERLRAWLKPADPSSNYHNALRRRQDGTGAWFLSDQEYDAWKRSAGERHRSPSLWLHGQSGCGKSFLATTIIEDLKLAEMPLIYFYFDFNDSGKQSLDALLRSMLYQLTLLSTETFQAAEKLRKSLDDQKPSINSLSHALQEASRSFRQLHVVLDALDEAEPRHEVIDWIRECLTSNDPMNRLRSLVTSRPEIDIKSTFKGLLDARRLTDVAIEAAATRDDIKSYIRGRLQYDSRLERWITKEEIQILIEQKLMEKADGMFRWVDCQLDSLCRCITTKELRTALDSLPKGLDETYARILTRIPAELRSSAIRLLQLLLYTHKQVTVEVAMNLVAVSLDDEVFFDKENQPSDPEEILAYSPSLFSLLPPPPRRDQGFEAWFPERTVGKESYVVQFAHLSVKQYLTSAGLTKSFQNELSSKVAGLAMTRIMIRAVETRYHHAWCHFTTRSNANSLTSISTLDFGYAGIPDLLEPASGDMTLPDRKHAFVAGEDNIEPWNPLSASSKLASVALSDSRSLTLDLDSADVFAGPGWIDDRPDDRPHLNLELQLHTPPGFGLGYFATRCWPEFARHAEELPAASVLIVDWLTGLDTHKNFESENWAPDTARRSPLTVAVTHRLRSVVAILLARAPNIGDPSALLRASVLNHDLDVLELLLRHGLHPSTELLRLACRTRQFELCKKLLDWGADVEYEPRRGAELAWKSDEWDPILTPLGEACFQQSYDLVRLLLQNGAQVNARSPSGRYVLRDALCRGRQAKPFPSSTLAGDAEYDPRIVTLLFDSGADWKLHFSEPNRSILDWAIETKYLDGMEAYQTRSADPSTICLSAVRKTDNARIMGSFLKHGVNPMASECHLLFDRILQEDVPMILKKPVLVVAAIRAQLDIVEVLLPYFIQADQGGSFARYQGRPLEFMVDTVLGDPLYAEYAIERWDRGLVDRHLIPALQSSSSEDKELFRNSLLLTRAFEKGDTEAIKSLMPIIGSLKCPRIRLEGSFDGFAWNVKVYGDEKIRTHAWLYQAIKHRDVDAVKLLLEAGVDPNGTRFAHDSYHLRPINTPMGELVRLLGPLDDQSPSTAEIEIANLLESYGGRVSKLDSSYLVEKLEKLNEAKKRYHAYQQEANMVTFDWSGESLEKLFCGVSIGS